MGESNTSHAKNYSWPNNCCTQAGYFRVGKDVFLLLLSSPTNSFSVYHVDPSTLFVGSRKGSYSTDSIYPLPAAEKVIAESKEVSTDLKTRKNGGWSTRRSTSRDAVPYPTENASLNFFVKGREECLLRHLVALQFSAVVAGVLVCRFRGREGSLSQPGPSPYQSARGQDAERTGSRYHKCCKDVTAAKFYGEGRVFADDVLC